jgi:hypothetical protein
VGRVLTISRLTVRPENEAEYLATVHALAALGAGRGQRLWVFKSSGKPYTYIECSESPTRASHRARASRTGDELRLEDRLRALATYASDAWELWEEVAVPAVPEEPEGWSPDMEENN